MEEKISTESSYPVPFSDAEIKEFIKEIPKSPGVYKFLDVSGNPLYIGKAKLLNKRVASYFRRSSRSKKIEKLLTQSQFIEFALTNTELESLLHEQYLIKELKPKFNVQFKDDKGYPWIKIETKKAYPAATSFLGKKLENGKFFGPFPNSYAVRDALKLIQKKQFNCDINKITETEMIPLQYTYNKNFYYNGNNMLQDTVFLKESTNESDIDNFGIGLLKNEGKTITEFQLLHFSVFCS